MTPENSVGRSGLYFFFFFFFLFVFVLFCLFCLFVCLFFVVVFFFCFFFWREGGREGTQMYLFGCHYASKADFIAIIRV